MTPFLATATRHGTDLAEQLRTARDREDIDALLKQMRSDVVAELAGRSALTAADHYLFFVAAAERTTDVPRTCAACYAAAGQVAMTARIPGRAPRAREGRGGPTLSFAARPDQGTSSDSISNSGGMVGHRLGCASEENMSNSTSKNAPKKPSTNKEVPSTASSVRDVVAHASHLREVVAILRAASVEFIGRFSGIGHALPELLLQRDGQGARTATVDAIMAAGRALDSVASEFEARARALMSLPVESGEVIEHTHTSTGIGVDQVVYRDYLDASHLPAVEKKPQAGKE